MMIIILNSYAFQNDLNDIRELKTSLNSYIEYFGKNSLKLL